MENYNLEEPIDFVKHNLNELVYLKCRKGIEIKGKLIAFDSHLNVILQDAEEVSGGRCPASGAGQPVQVKRNFPMLYVRGDGIILISPLVKSIL